MTPDEAETVCEFVILESQNKLCHLDMRLMPAAHLPPLFRFPDYAD
jgi:hypothetical protein